MATKELKIHTIKVLPLYGMAEMFDGIDRAIVFIKEQPETGLQGKPLVRMEVTVRYTDGTVLDGGFPHKYRAIEFLDVFIRDKFGSLNG